MTKDEEIGQRLKARRKKMNLTQAALGKMIGVTSTAVGNWEKAKNSIGGKLLTKAAEALETSESYLMLRTDNPRPVDFGVLDDSTEYLGRPTNWDSETEIDSGQVPIPIYNDLELAAGSGANNQEQTNGRHIYFAKSTLRNHSVDPASAVCLKVRGNSLSPEINDGDQVMIDLSDTTVVDGGIFAIEQSGHYRLKVLYIQPDRYRIHSYNSDEYPDEYAGFDEVNIIGAWFHTSRMRKR